VTPLDALAPWRALARLGLGPEAAVTVLRGACLYLPVAVTAVLWRLRRPGPSARAGLLLAAVWNLVALAALQAGAREAGWWHFDARGGLLLGMPVDLYLGWILLWSAIPPLAAPRLPLAATAALFLGLDLVAMPRLAPLVQVGPHWLAGEAAGCALCLVPAQLLARWTRDGVHLAGRATLQACVFAGLTLFLLPAVILEQAGGGWQSLLGRPPWLSSILLQLLAILGVPGLAAVQELAARGRGTPLPFDPPSRLVTSGPYAYVANPMQIAGVLLLTAWGLVLGSLWVAAAGPMCHLYSAGFAAWHEDTDLARRFGGRYRVYRREVRAWLPRWRPWHPSLGAGAAAAAVSTRSPQSVVLPQPAAVPQPQAPPPARLYLAESCLPCSQLRTWLADRRPTALLLLAAEDHPGRDLERITYDPADGSPEESGVAALARALEHLHLGYAFLGWTARLPLLRPALQLLADAAGGFPRRVPRRPLDAVSASLLSSPARERQRSAGFPRLPGQSKAAQALFHLVENRDPACPLREDDRQELVEAHLLPHCSSGQGGV
jgi:protein-S-isoprenylcysteine O-methyltransferase Ste14